MESRSLTPTSTSNGMSTHTHIDEDGHRAKRFKHQSYNELLRNVHAPSALSNVNNADATEEATCAFHDALLHWMQLNLSPGFVIFARKAEPLSQSLPLLLHSWRDVLDLWFECAAKKDEEALKAFFDLLQKLVEDLQLTLRPAYEEITSFLCEFLVRRLSPDAFTALLPALQAVFKVLLVPSLKESTSDLLGYTWATMSASLSKSNHEIRRTVSEVWASVIRRCKTSERQKCIRLMINDLNGNDDVVAWSLVFSAKSVGQTVHTSASHTIAVTIEGYLAASNEQHDGVYKLVRRLLTALVHHCAKPEQFSDIVDTIMTKADALKEDTAPTVQKRILDVLLTVCSVRSGSRIRTRDLTRILDLVTRCRSSLNLRRESLGLITAVLCASTSDLSIWMSSGRRVIEYIWEHDSVLAVQVTGATLELGWKGFNQFALPPFTRNFPRLLSQRTNEDTSCIIQAFRVLAKVSADGVAKGTDPKVGQALNEWVEHFFVSFNFSAENVLLLSELLHLSHTLDQEMVLRNFVSIAQALVKKSAEAEKASQRIEAYALATSLKAISKAMRLLKKDSPHLRDLLFDVIKMFWWSEHVLDSCLDLARTISQVPVDKEVRAPIIERLSQNLLSHSSLIRRCSLELMSSPVFLEDPHSTSLKACLEAEHISIDVQGSRERVLATSRVGKGASEISVTSKRLRLAWLIGQLKVGLRPLWSAAADAISALSQHSESEVWASISSQLSSLDDLKERKDDFEGQAGLETVVDDINEEERMWRDPSAHKLRLAVSSWFSPSLCVHQVIKAQMCPDRLDVAAFEIQLLETLGKISSIAEKHSRELVPMFLLTANRDSLDKATRTRLRSWLKLLSKFSNPKALFRSADVRQAYLSILSHPDRELQILSLSCLQSFKDPALTRHGNLLSLLLDDARWRDELASLDFQTFAEEERDAVIPILIRMFYGMIRERGSTGRGVGRRAALLGALGSCSEKELDLLVSLMTDGFPEPGRSNSNGAWTISETINQVPKKHQIGFLMLLNDVLKHVGSRLGHSVERLFAFTVSMTGLAQRDIQVGSSEAQEIQDAGSEEGDDGTIENALPSSVHQSRSCRHQGVKRLAQFFQLPIEQNFSQFIPEIYDAILTPRLELFDRENAQAPSALFELLEAWTMRTDTVMFLVQFNKDTLQKVYDCLITRNVKSIVSIKVVDMAERIIAISANDEDRQTYLIRPYLARLLANIATCVDRATQGGGSQTIDLLLQKEISLVSKLSAFAVEVEQVEVLTSLFLTLLAKSQRGSSERSKCDMLTTLRNLFPQVFNVSSPADGLQDRALQILSSLFQRLQSRQARLTLVDTFCVFSNSVPGLETISGIVASLNAYSKVRIDQPDFDRRLAAFAAINETRWTRMSATEWTPVLHNMLYFIRDEEELSIRSNAALCLRRFLERLASSTEAESLQPSFSRILYPGLKLGLRSRHDAVHAEVLGVIAYAVENCGDLASMKELRVLLAGGDEEANFFNNICHVQVHRRIRALHRLADFCDSPGFRNNTYRELLMPIVSRLLIDGADHHLVNEAISTLGRMSQYLTWSTYFWLVQRYLKRAGEHVGSQRVASRVVVSLLTHFNFSLDDTFVVDPSEGQELEDDDDQDDERVVPGAKGTSQSSKILDSVTRSLLPSLFKNLERRDELEDNNRIPLATGVAKICLRLPADQKASEVSRLLTVVAQIFRSKSQETRDIARDTLSKVIVILGPSSLGLAFRQLREALQRGPHLHVLASVTHNLLVHVTSKERSSIFKELDDCVPDAAHVAAEVVFGQSGRDVSNDGFKTKLKEVRGSGGKGLDTFGLLAQNITPAAISSLLEPIKAVLHETLSEKIMQAADECLQRIASSLTSNTHFSSSDLLSLSFNLVNQNGKFFTHERTFRRRKSKAVSDVSVDLKRKKTVEVNHFEINSWRFVVFGLNLFTTMYRRGRFVLQDSDVLARLEPFVSIIGNTLYASNGSVIVAGLKATVQISKCPLESMENSLPIFVRQCLEIVKSSGTTDSDTSQAALKTLSIIIRDCPSLQLKEKDLSFLVEVIAPDLEDASRQTIAFPVLRAVVARKFVVPEIYDLMDQVRQILVTSQSGQVQELCRGVFLQFLLDYPQGKGRLKQQFTFLARNLSYVHESGRLSVMEIMRAIITKFNDDIIQEYSDMLFIPLVLVVAQDDSPKCREMASQLLKLLFGRLDEEQRSAKVSYVHSWASAKEKVALAKVSSQIYGFMLDCTKEQMELFIPSILEDLTQKIHDAVNDVDRDEDEGSEAYLGDGSWQVPYHALTTLGKACQVFPSIIEDHSWLPWISIRSLLFYPHAWVRSSSCRLLGMLFATRPVTAPEKDPETLEKVDEAPLFCYESLRSTANALTLQLKSEHLDDSSSLQVVKNLFYIGKCFLAASSDSVEGVEPRLEDDNDTPEALSDGDGEEDDAEERGRDPLPWLFSRLSYQARSAHIARQKSSKQKNWTKQIEAIFKWFAAMASYMDGARLDQYLVHILSPLCRVLDETAIKEPSLDELKTLATEVQTLLQSKCGTTRFAEVHTQIRKGITAVRDERRAARAVLAVRDPREAARRKRKIHEKTKELKKGQKKRKMRA